MKRDLWTPAMELEIAHGQEDVERALWERENRDITGFASRGEVWSFQAAAAAWNRHHVPDLLAGPRADYIWGNSTKAIGLRSAHYFGIGTPTIRQWGRHWDDAGIGHMTHWWRHPNDFYRTHRHAPSVSTQRIKDERNRRRGRHPTGGITYFDGVKIASWIATVLYYARQDNVYFRIDSGYRSIAEQWDLYNHPQGYPVAYPGTSMHNFYIWPRGAVDVYTGQEALSRWCNSHPSRARGLVWAGGKDRVHFSHPIGGMW